MNVGNEMKGSQVHWKKWEKLDLVSENMYREVSFYLHLYLMCFLMLTNFQTLLLHLNRQLQEQLKYCTLIIIS